MKHAITGTIVDIVNNRMLPGTLHIDNGIITTIEEHALSTNSNAPFILPGFIDAHIHLESTMMPPSEFARIAVQHGTIGAVADPHEIANVLGIPGVTWMIASGNNVPFYFYWGASPCVPATPFDQSGATLDSASIDMLLDNPAISHLSEVMNVPGVLHNDPEIIRKIAAAKKHNKPIDGHCPELRGNDLQRYIDTGISTDHESSTYDEAEEKIQRGMTIQIREGSAARNFDALYPLLKKYPKKCMLCSDDKHPHDLIKGHINELVQRAVAHGIPLINVLRAATLNPIRHYNLTIGLLQKGDPADCIIVEDLKTFKILATYIKGHKVFDGTNTLIPHISEQPINNFHATAKTPQDFAVPAQGSTLRVIQAYDGQLLTDAVNMPACIENGYAIADPKNDLLKIVLVNRYTNQRPAVAFITGFGLQKGALASSVSHDSHNILAVGATDEAIARAINLVIQHQGGMSFASEDHEQCMPLPVAGLMSTDDYATIAKNYGALNLLAKNNGCTLTAPYMTLSFMALLVIPRFKLGPQGLFDAQIMAYISLFK